MSALRTKRRTDHGGDVHVGSMSGDVAPVPGSTTSAGREAIEKMADDVLEKVRRHVLRQEQAR
jgi:hypothetical protein